MAEILNERRLGVNYTTIFRWVQCYEPELDIYNSEGKAEIFVPSRRFSREHFGLFANSQMKHTCRETLFPKTLKAPHNQTPRVITVDKNAVYPKAIDELKAQEELPESVELRQSKYLNNIVEQDYRAIKRLVSQKQVGGKVGKPKTSNPAFSMS